MKLHAISVRENTCPRSKQWMTMGNVYHPRKLLEHPNYILFPKCLSWVVISAGSSYSKLGPLLHMAFHRKPPVPETFSSALHLFYPKGGGSDYLWRPFENSLGLRFEFCKRKSCAHACTYWCNAIRSSHIQNSTPVMFNITNDTCMFLDVRKYTLQYSLNKL